MQVVSQQRRDGEPGTSHWTHVGGFLMGLFPAMLVLPVIGGRRKYWENFIPVIGGFMMVALLVALPTYAWTVRLNDVQCT